MAPAIPAYRLEPQRTCKSTLSATTQPYNCYSGCYYLGVRTDYCSTMIIPNLSLHHSHILLALRPRQ
jgi:hypothetical protein